MAIVAKKLNDRERLINNFILLIFKGKAQKHAQAKVMSDAKAYIAHKGKKWTARLDLLFRSTWSKKIPLEIIEEVKNPNSLVKPSPKRPTDYGDDNVNLGDIELNFDDDYVETEEDEESEFEKEVVILQQKKESKPLPPKHILNKRQYTLVKEPTDIDDPIYDKPIVVIKPSKRTCAKCGREFTRSDSYPNFMLCPDCDRWSKNIFSINEIYAATLDVFDIDPDADTVPTDPDISGIIDNRKRKAKILGEEML